MTPDKVYEKFKVLFPMYAYVAESYIPNGKGSVRVVLKDIGEFVFTYKTATNWTFETKSSFLDRLVGRKG